MLARGIIGVGRTTAKLGTDLIDVGGDISNLASGVTSVVEGTAKGVYKTIRAPDRFVRWVNKKLFGKPETTLEDVKDSLDVGNHFNAEQVVRQHGIHRTLRRGLGRMRDMPAEAVGPSTPQAGTTAAMPDWTAAISGLTSAGTELRGAAQALASAAESLKGKGKGGAGEAPGGTAAPTMPRPSTGGGSAADVPQIIVPEVTRRRGDSAERRAAIRSPWGSPIAEAVKTPQARLHELLAQQHGSISLAAVRGAAEDLIRSRNASSGIQALHVKPTMGGSATPIDMESIKLTASVPPVLADEVRHGRATGTYGRRRPGARGGFVISPQEALRGLSEWGPGLRRSAGFVGNSFKHVFGDSFDWAASNVAHGGRLASWAGRSAMTLGGAGLNAGGSALAGVGRSLGRGLTSDLFGGGPGGSVNNAIGGRLTSLARMRVLPRWLPRAFQAAGGVGGLARLGGIAFVANGLRAAGESEFAYSQAELLNVSGDRSAHMENNLARADAMSSALGGKYNPLTYVFKAHANESRRIMMAAQQNDSFIEERRAAVRQTSAMRASAMGLSTDPQAQLAAIDLEHENAKATRAASVLPQKQERSNVAQGLEDRANDADARHWYKLWHRTDAQDREAADLRGQARQVRDQSGKMFADQETGQEAAQTKADDERKKAIERGQRAQNYGISAAAYGNAMSVDNDLGGQAFGINAGYEKSVIKAGDNGRLVNALRGAQKGDVDTLYKRYDRQTGNMAGDNTIAGYSLYARNLTNQHLDFAGQQAGFSTQVAQAQEQQRQALQGVDETDPRQKARADEIRKQFAIIIDGVRSDAQAAVREFQAQKRVMAQGTSSQLLGLAGRGLAGNTQRITDEAAEQVRLHPELQHEIEGQRDADLQGARMGDAEQHFGLSMGTKRIEQSAGQQRLRNNFLFRTADVTGVVDETKDAIEEANVELRGPEHDKDRLARIKALKDSADAQIGGLTNPLKHGNRLEQVSAYVTGGDRNNVAFDDLRKARGAAKDADQQFDDVAAKTVVPGGGDKGNGPTSSQVDQIIQFLQALTSGNYAGAGV